VVADVRFAHSPGRFDPSFLNSLRTFDAALILDCDDGTRGVVAVETKYYDWLKPELPKPQNLHRYLEVAARSGVFAPGATDELQRRGPLAVMWLEHLLLLSMLQHESGMWTWGRLVVVHPAGNVDVAAGCEHYRALLVDTSTFASTTLEQLLAGDALSKAATATLRERYIVS
jgi:hypothetical protein